MKKSFKKLISLLILPILMTSCSSGQSKVYTKEDIGDISYVRSSPKNTSTDNIHAYQLACNCVAYDLQQLGFTVKKGVVVIDQDIYVPGYIFTNKEIAYFDDSTGYTVFNAGFFQIHDSSSTDDFLLTKDIIEHSHNSIVTVAEDDGDKLYSYDLSIEAMIDSYSGVYDRHFFKYIQTDLHVITVTVEEDNPVFYDANVDLYSFDKSRYIFKANPTSIQKQEALALYSDDMMAYKIAVDAARDVIDYQNNNGLKTSISSVLLIDSELIAEYEKFNTVGKLDEFVTDNLKSLNLKGNEFVHIDKDGNFSIETAIYTDSYIKHKELMGFINAVASIVAIATTVVMCVVVPAGSGIFTCTAFKLLTAGASILLSVDKLSQGIQEIIYTHTGQYDKEATGLIKQAFQAIAGDELGNTLFKAFEITSFTLNVFNGIAGLKLGQFTSNGFWYATKHIVRVLAVKLVQTVISAAATSITSTLVTNAVYTATGEPFLASVAGAASGAVAGFATGFILDRLDRKFNFSGLYSKNDIKSEINDEDFDLDEAKQKKENGGQSGSGTPAADTADDPDTINTNTFNNLTDSQKEYTYQKVVNQLTSDLNLENKPQVCFYNSSRDPAVSYRADENIIYINRTKWNDVGSCVDEIGKAMKLSGSFENFNVQPTDIQEELIQTGQNIRNENASVQNGTSTSTTTPNTLDQVPQGGSLDNQISSYGKEASDTLVEEDVLSL